MNKLELNEKLAKLYPEISRILENAESELSYIYYIVDDSARIFDLMLEYNILLDFDWLNAHGQMLKYFTARVKDVFYDVEIEFVKDHDSESEAARFAIAMALVKLAEDKIICKY